MIITVRVAFATIVRRNTTRIAARFRHIIFANSDTPGSEPLIFEETVEHTSNCEFFFKITICLHFGSRFHPQNVPQRSPPFTH